MFNFFPNVLRYFFIIIIICLTETSDKLSVIVVDAFHATTLQQKQQQQVTFIQKYPFPLNCSKEERNQIYICEKDAKKVWHVDDATYVSSE